MSSEIEIMTPDEIKMVNFTLSEIDIITSDELKMNFTLAPTPVDHPSPALILTRMIVQRILVPIITSGGIIGNLFNVAVLRCPKMRSSTNVYLMALALCDMMYLSFTFALSFISCRETNQPEAAFYFIPFGRVLSDLFGNTAVWLTVAFTLERYVGVCHPMKGKAWCTIGKAKCAIVLVFLLCFFNTFPEFFERQIVEIETISNNVSTSVLQCSRTEFAMADSYQIGYYWWYVTLFTFVPLVLLSVFNSLLIRSVLIANRRRHMLANACVVGDNQRQSKEQQKVTIMLIAVVLIFLVCQLPWTILLLYNTYLSSNNIVTSGDSRRIAGNICNLLVQINASVNFLLYSYFSSRFRRTFKQLICRWQKKKRRQSASMTSNDTFRKSESTTMTSTSSCKSKAGTYINYTPKKISVEIQKQGL